MAEANEATKKPPPTLRDVFNALGRVREAAERDRAVRAASDFLGLFEAAAAHTAKWGAAMRSDQGRRVRGAMNAEQRSTVQSLLDRADAARRRARDLALAGRIGEATLSLADHVALTSDATGLLHEFFSRLDRGLSTARIGENFCPPGLGAERQRVEHRDHYGRIVSIIKIQGKPLPSER